MKMEFARVGTMAAEVWQDPLDMIKKKSQNRGAPAFDIQMFTMTLQTAWFAERGDRLKKGEAP